MEGQQVTAILLTRPQSDALWLAACTGAGGLRERQQRWSGSPGGSWVSNATVMALVAAGLLRRFGARHAKITDAGHDALAADERRSQGRALQANAKTLKQIAADANEPIPEITRNADGSIEFKCAGCGEQVFMAIDDGFGFPACFECRWHGEHPQLRRPEVRS